VRVNRSGERDVVRVARRRAPVLAGRDAGEGSEFAVEMRLVAVAMRQRKIRS
jgi:hypothetical protein